MVMSLVDITTNVNPENIPTKGYSQAQIAKKIGVSVGMLSEHLKWLRTNGREGHRLNPDKEELFSLYKSHIKSSKSQKHNLASLNVFSSLNVLNESNKILALKNENILLARRHSSTELLPHHRNIIRFECYWSSGHFVIFFIR